MVRCWRVVVVWDMVMHRINVANHVRFLTFSCYQRLRLFDDLELRDAFADRIERLRSEHEWKLLAWVIMPEHIHLVVYPKDGKVTEMLVKIKQGFAQRVVHRWKQESSPILPKVTSRGGQTYFWQRGGGHDRVVRDRKELNHVIGYVHMNPVERGLVERPIDWRWSSARDYAGMEGLIRLTRM